MDEPGARGVSLWLMPEGEAGRRLGALIDRLAARLGTPAFPPHVTLLPGIERPVDPAFFPHLSLVYGSLEEPAQRALAAEVGPLVSPVFSAATLHVWRTAGCVAQWREIGVLSLAGASPRSKNEVPRWSS